MGAWIENSEVMYTCTGRGSFDIVLVLMIIEFEYIVHSKFSYSAGAFVRVTTLYHDYTHNHIHTLHIPEH